MAFLEGYWTPNYKFVIMQAFDGKRWVVYAKHLKSGQQIVKTVFVASLDRGVSYAKDRIEADAMERASKAGHLWSTENFDIVWERARQHGFTHPHTWPENLDVAMAEEAKRDHEAAKNREQNIDRLLSQYARQDDPKVRQRIRQLLRQQGYYLSRQIPGVARETVQ